MWQVGSLLCFEYADISSGTTNLEAVAPGYLRRKTTKCPQVGNPVGGCCLGLPAGFGAPLVGPAPENSKPTHILRIIMFVGILVILVG